MENLKIIKTLGSGIFGTTYMVKKISKKKKYALKTQKILKSYITGGTKYYMWRELRFYLWINKLKKSDQIFFMKMLDYKFYSNCSYTNKKQLDAKNKIVKKLINSKHCLDLLLDLKDGTLNDLFKLSKRKLLSTKSVSKEGITNNKSKPILSQKQFYSMIIQITYICYLLNKSGYIHNDLHSGNIAFKKIPYNKKLSININDNKYKIKSYGYQWSIIDYGLILHKKFIMKKKEQKTYKNGILYNKDMKVFFIVSLTNIRSIIWSKIDKAISLNKLYQIKPDLYHRIKILIISIYPSMNVYYDDFEFNNKVNKLLYDEVIQFLAIYDIKFLEQIFDIKKIKLNNIPNNHLEFLKLNLSDYNSIIKYFIDLII